jgi:hypothetical protein
VELRQYTLKPGQRDVLIELFDRELVESQEDVGMEIIGQFRDLDRPERFVWLRGFPDMERRREALEAFYGGPVWKTHASAANATMIDVDDVLLLRPVSAESGFGPQPERPAHGEQVPATRLVVTVCSLAGPADPAVIEALAATGSSSLAMFVEEPSENTFPALPVRTGEHVVVWIQRDPAPIPELPDFVTAVQQLRLDPTSRSRLR